MDRQLKCMALEQKHVHDVYERTAHHFSDVRYRAWPRVRQFLADLEPASLVADVGCGSGKYLHINKDVFKIGCDRSSGLVDIAHSRHHSVLVCDNLHLPYRDNAFDAVISIGVIHHLTTRERRVQALRELARVLRPGGKLMVYVWAMEQRHRQFEAQDVLVPWNFQATFKHKRKKDPSRLKNTQRDTLSDEEGDAVTSGGDHQHKKPAHRITPVNRCRGLRHHGIGDNIKQKNHDCKQKRKTYHKQRDFVLAQSSHSRDGGSSSGASISSPSFDAGSGPGGPADQHSSMEVSVGIGNGLCGQPEREKKGTLKNWMVNLFSSSQKDLSKEPQRIAWSQGSLRKLKDYEYKQLICQIVKEDIEMYKKQRPLLEHSLSASDVDIFAVREFPQSSQPGLRKMQSLDSEKPTKSLKCSAHTKDIHGTEKNENSTSHKSGDNKEAVEKVVQAVVTYNCCQKVNGADEGKSQEVFSIRQENGHSSSDKIAKTEKLPCQIEPTAESKDDTVATTDISNVKDGNTKPSYYSNTEDSLQEPFVNDLSIPTSSVDITESPRDYLTQKCPTNSNGNTTKNFNTNGVGLAHIAMTDSSPESPSGESELNGHEGSQEGSSLSSPEEDIALKAASGTVLAGQLEAVEDIQYPSLSDSDADEWARVTVKAIRMMQTEVLRKVGTSTDSVSSRYAVLGSSADLQDVEDEDIRSPLWLDTEPNTPIKSRYLHHGSCESSSLSSDPYTESEGDDGGQGLGDSPVIIDRTTPPAQLSNHSSIYPRRDYLISPVEKRLHTSPKSDLWNRRRMHRRYQSLSVNNNPADTTSPVHKQEEALHNNPPQTSSQLATKEHGGIGKVTSPSTTIADSDDQNDNNIKLISPTLPSEVPLMESSTLSSTQEEEEVPETPTDGGTETHYHRYYHVFREGELVSLIQNHVQHLHILDSYYDNANWCVVAEKVRVWTI